MVPFAALLVAATIWPAPNRVPTHWSSDLPDSFSSGAGVFSITLSVAGFCAIAAALVALLAVLIPALWARWVIALLAAVGAGAAATYGAVAWGTRLSGGPERVHVAWALAPVLIALLWAVLTYLLHRPPPVDRQEVIDSVPERSRVVPVRGGEPAPWATQVRSGTLTGTAIFVAVVLTVTTVVAWLGSALMGVVVGLLTLVLVLVVLAWSRVEVRVDATGLTIVSTLVPLRLLQVAAVDVVGVETAELDPMKWGGIGLRWLPDRTAYIVRGGPGIVIHRASGRRFGVEITQGEEVAAAGTRALLQSAAVAQGGGGSRSRRG